MKEDQVEGAGPTRDMRAPLAGYNLAPFKPINF